MNRFLLPGVKASQTTTANKIVIHSKPDMKHSNACDYDWDSITMAMHNHNFILLAFVYPTLLNIFHMKLQVLRIPLHS